MKHFIKISNRNNNRDVILQDINRYRLAYLTNISSPYRIEMVEAWARLNPSVEISVYYTDKEDQGRGWDTRPIRGVKEYKLPVIAELKRYGKINRGLLDIVRQHDIVMIGGFEQASYFIAALLSRIHEKPVILLFDGFSPARFDVESPFIRAVKRITAFLCDGFFANGKVSRMYLLNYIRVGQGKPIHNQFLSHSDRFITEARQQLGMMSKQEIRRRLGIATGRLILLFCGYLIRRKRIDLIIEAISRLPEPQRPLLLVVGRGPLETSLAKQAEASNVPILFVGFKQQVDLASYYFAADALVLASEDDPWGLVVNEAMSAGLPVIVSDACGVAMDLVRDAQNGFIFRNRDAQALAKAISRVLSSDLYTFGETSRSVIEGWTSEHSAISLGRCIRDVLLRKHAEGGIRKKYCEEKRS